MHKLNVIFHGTYVFSKLKLNGSPTPDKLAYVPGFEVKIPTLQGHVYRAGNWLAEIDLPPGKYKLEGVELLGTDELDEERNLVVKRKTPSGDAPGMHAHIFLPLPVKLSTPSVIGKLKTNIEDPAGEAGEMVGALQVFTYHVDQDDQLRVSGESGQGGLTWEPVLTKGVYNLHFFAAHEHHRVGGTIHKHVQEAFDACMKISGSNIRLKPDIILGGGVLDTAQLPEGVLPEETEGLESRIRRMSMLGRMKKTGRDLNLLWFESESLDSDPGACTDSGDC